MDICSTGLYIEMLDVRVRIDYW